MDKAATILRSNVSTPHRAVEIAVPILGLIGMGISSYLTYIHYQNLNSICLFNFKCDAVLTSPYSAIWGVPLSLFGLLMYIALTVLGFWSLRAEEESKDLLALGMYTLSLSGTLFTIYLYYLEIFEIHAFCTWCIGSSIVIVSLLVLSLINLFTLGKNPKAIAHLLRFKLSHYIQW